MLKNKSKINRKENNFKVEIPKFLQKISFRFADVSLEMYHKKMTKNNFIINIGITS